MLWRFLATFALCLVAAATGFALTVALIDLLFGIL